MNKGFAALSTVLILASVVVSIALTVSLLSIGEAQSGLALFKGEDNLNLVEGCVEDVMLKVRADQNYSANGATISRPEGICTITVNNGLGGPVNWDLTIASQQIDYQRSVRTVFTRNLTGMVLASWQEIAPAIPEGPTATPTSTPTSTPTNTPTPTPTTPAGDTIPPAAVTNLAAAAGPDPRTTMDLSWSAPADNVGVTSYDIRYSLTAITEANWASATQVSGEPTPTSPGTPQSYTVTGLVSNKTHYFAIKSSDAALNISAISNVVSKKTAR